MVTDNLLFIWLLVVQNLPLHSVIENGIEFCSLVFGGRRGWRLGFCVCCIGLEGEINASTFYLVTAAYRTDPDQINLQNFAV